MSCGRHHDVACALVLDRVYRYLDGELELAELAEVRQHLEECGPCLREFGVEEEVKSLVRRACAAEPVPSTLRQRVLLTIRSEVSVQVRY